MIYLFLILFLGLVIYGYVRYRRHRQWARALIAAGCTGLIAAAGWHAVSYFTAPQRIDLAVRTRETGYQWVAARRLCRHVAETCPGARVVVLLPVPNVFSPGYARARIAGMEDGLGGKVTVVDRVTPPVPEEWADIDPDKFPEPRLATMPARRSAYTARFLDDTARRYADRCDILVLLCGLPDDVEKLSYLRGSDAPRMAILTEGYALGGFLDWARGNGRLVAAVLKKTDPEYRTLFPRDDPDEAFGLRYELVTK